MKVPACASLEKSQAQVTVPNYLPKFKTPNETEANSQCPRFQLFANKDQNEAFGYLRTVIVTTAVHWGRLPCHQVTHFLNLPALGRHQPPYMVLRLCGDLCFW